ASDPSHYLGVEAAIQIEKTPDLTEVPRGVGHTFSIEVTNVGTVPLTDVEVTDPVTPSCDRVIGDMAVDEVVTYECDIDAVFEVIDNTAFVEGLDPVGGVVTDEDDARVIPVEVGGTAQIGDTVWRDDNRNGVQDDGEPGIAGARVRIRTISNTPFASSPPTAMPLAIDVTLVTNADGHYLEPALVAGTYEVSLDMSSVNGSLTTPGVDVIPLDVGDTRLDADFGVVVDDLPFTGADALRLAGAALALVLMGGGILLTTRHGSRLYHTIRA
ncbi:MAG TPA: SdrD B-like domain-containing protein, partial [Acidimicrobiia bacterium]